MLQVGFKKKLLLLRIIISLAFVFFIDINTPQLKSVETLVISYFWCDDLMFIYTQSPPFRLVLKIISLLLFNMLDFLLYLIFVGFELLLILKKFVKSYNPPIQSEISLKTMSLTHLKLRRIFYKCMFMIKGGSGSGSGPLDRLYKNRIRNRVPCDQWWSTGIFGVSTLSIGNRCGTGLNWTDIRVLTF